MEQTQNEQTSERQLPEVISREDLYALVWSEPMSRLAVRFGLSDVGLSKACTRMLIPVPGRGYWAKKEVGRAPRPTRLPTLPTSAGNDKREMRVRRRAAPSAAEAALENGEAIEVIVPEILAEPHPLVAKSVKALRGGRSRQEGYLVPRNPNCLTVSATMGSIDRAMRIYDAVIRAIEDRGHVVEIQKYQRDGYPDPEFRTVVLVDEEQVEIDISETTRRAERVRVGPNDLSPKYEFIPSGRLSLSIKKGFGGSMQWHDGARYTLESQLGKFIHGLAVAALDLKEARRAREKREQEEREARQREWDEMEWRRAEAGRVRALDAEIDRMHSVRWAREYLVQLKADLAANPDANTPEMQVWVEWVEDHAKRIDPFTPHAVVPKDPKPYGY